MIHQKHTQIIQLFTVCIVTLEIVTFYIVNNLWYRNINMHIDFCFKLTLYVNFIKFVPIQ